MSQFEQILSGLELIHGIDPQCKIDAEHDKVYVSCSVDLSDADQKRMEEWGWSDEGYDGWMHFT